MKIFRSRGGKLKEIPRMLIVKTSKSKVFSTQIKRLRRVTRNHTSERGEKMAVENLGLDKYFLTTKGFILFFTSLTLNASSSNFRSVTSK